MIFIDRSVPRGVADYLKQNRDDVIWHDDIFPRNTKDVVWLREVGRRGWMIISHDKQLRHRPSEKRALKQSGGGCFVLAYRDNLSKEEVYELVVSALDEMLYRFTQEPRPFLYTITKNLEFKEYIRGELE